MHWACFCLAFRSHRSDARSCKYNGLQRTTALTVSKVVEGHVLQGLWPAHFQASGIPRSDSSVSMRCDDYREVKPARKRFGVQLQVSKTRLA